MSYEAYSLNLQQIIEAVFTKSEPMKELTDLFMWSSSLIPLSENFDHEEIYDLSIKILSSLNVCLNKLPKSKIGGDNLQDKVNLTKF